MKRAMSWIGLIFVLLWATAGWSASGVKVKRLVIEKRISPHVGKSIELVSFGPGSGWIKLITPDRLSPIIDFKSVSPEQVDRFNRFAESIDYPFRTLLVRDTLHVRHMINRVVSAQTIVDPKATRLRNPRPAAAHEGLALHRQPSGTVRLAAATPPAGGDTALASRASRLRKAGFKLIQQGFSAIENTPDLEETVVLKTVRIRIVGDRKHFRKETAAYGTRLLGYATSDNEITVLGKRVGDQLVINQAVLGHELTHLLNFRNLAIANPDDLDEWGL